MYNQPFSSIIAYFSSMKTPILFALIGITNIGCAGSQKTSFSPVGVVALHNYTINTDVVLPDSVNYFFITKEDIFYKNFSMTKASPKTIIVPDFGGQSVVAIALPPSAKVISVDINAAEANGGDLNVFYTVTDTTSWKTYPHTPFAAATVPKITGLKRVTFYRDKTKEKTLLLTD